MIICNTPRKTRPISRTEEILQEHDFPIRLFAGWKIMEGKNKKYFIIYNCDGYPIASRGGRMPYHRFVLFETLGRPISGCCKWCGYVLPWQSSLSHSCELVIHADHLDGNTFNNSPANLVPSCSWCNKNRNWAEAHPDFWKHWRKWLACVPPGMRPNLPEIASDFGIDTTKYFSQFKKQDEE